MTAEPVAPTPKPTADVAEQGWQEVRDALRGLQFGSVTVILQDGVIVQVERLEKRRVCRRRDRLGTS
jgi:hypothetical protein